MRNFNGINRLVVKIGTNLLTDKDKLNDKYLEQMASQIAEIKQRGIQVLLVTSGAIGIGAGVLGLRKNKLKMDLRQACAAVGQPLLMEKYKSVFAEYGILTAQVLLTREHFNHRESYLNLRNSVEKLLELNVLPIINENDSVSTREIGDFFGDNDSLSAHAASKLDAELLVLLSDIDGLYTKNPHKYTDAEPVRLVEKVNDEIRKMAGTAGSEFSTGGMVTKLKAVDIVSKAGCRMVLAYGKTPGVLLRILDGEELGTLFLAGKKLNSRIRWILNAVPRGTILVDQGAEEAVEKRKSLLPSGVTGVEGVFDSGDVISINGKYKAVTNLSSSEIKEVAGKHSREILNIWGKRDDIARPEDIVPVFSE